MFKENEMIRCVDPGSGGLLTLGMQYLVASNQTESDPYIYVWVAGKQQKFYARRFERVE